MRSTGFRVGRPVVPFLGIAGIAFAVAGLRTAGTNWSLVADAALGTLVFALIGLGLPWSRFPAASLLLLPVAVDGVLMLLREAQGGSTSGYSPLAILPVAWVGLTQNRRAVTAMGLCTSALFAIPIALIGAPLYPATGWRGVVTWTIVAFLVGFGANRVVAVQKRYASISSARAQSLDRLVETQMSIARADLGIDAVMTIAAEGALALTGADGACIEVLDGDEIVCTAGAGVALAYLGLRLRADESITGECFRTQETLICHDSETDSRVAREACQLVGARSLIVVPLLHDGEVRGVLVIWSATAHEFQGYEGQLLNLLATSVGAALGREQLLEQVTHQAITDDLTGLPNRRAWYGQLEQAMARARRSSQPLTVLMMDIDGFKQVNDQEGHAAGDLLLQSMSRSWSTALRPTDVLGRLGGDEFGVILELTDESDAGDLVTRLARSLDNNHHASAGVARWDGSEGATALVARADARMYARKRGLAQPQSIQQRETQQPTTTTRVA